jgi:hypothetical protein
MQEVKASEQELQHRERKTKAAHTHTSLARRGAGLGLISPRMYERGDPHTDESDSLEPKPSRNREL